MGGTTREIPIEHEWQSQGMSQRKDAQLDVFLQNLKRDSETIMY